MIKAKVLLDKNFMFKKFPICPPIRTARNRGQKFKNSSKTISLVSWPAKQKKELMRINNDAAAAICLGYPAFIRKRIGLKNIPPPIPTTPEKKPIIDPIIIEKKFDTFFNLNSLFLRKLLSINSNIPATAKIINNNI